MADLISYRCAAQPKHEKHGNAEAASLSWGPDCLGRGPWGNSSSKAFQKTSRSQRMTQSCGFTIWSTAGHPALGVQRKVQRNGMTALGTRPLLALAPYGTELRCTLAHGRPPLQYCVSVLREQQGAR